MGLGGFPLGTVDTARVALATGLDPLEETGLGAFLVGRPRAATVEARPRPRR